MAISKRSLFRKKPQGYWDGRKRMFQNMRDRRQYKKNMKVLLDKTERRTPADELAGKMLATPRWKGTVKMSNDPKCEVGSGSWTHIRALDLTPAPAIEPKDREPAHVIVPTVRQRAKRRSA